MPETSLEEELAIQRQYERAAHASDDRFVVELVAREFEPPDQQMERVVRSLQMTVGFAGQNVPFYQTRFREAGFDAGVVQSVADMENLPILRRTDVQNYFDALKCSHVPRDLGRTYVTQSSGSTGQPVSVRRTRYDQLLFAILWQRHPRWFRLNLLARFARIRSGGSLARNQDGSTNRDGATKVLSRWLYAGQFYRTGDEFHFNQSNPIPHQLDWLTLNRPSYVMTRPEVMEMWALENNGRPLPESVSGLIAVSSRLSGAARHRIETSFGIPIHQNYGLNEVGLVAIRCEAGNYHVHSESCCCEIVDDSGVAVAPGREGRLLVTSFANHAMPLLRYDTTDLATAGDGPCPCGRTLPHFRDVVGRYRRYALTPPGTRKRVEGLISTIGHLPDHVVEGLQQYQVWQSRDDGFELRVRTKRAISDELRHAIATYWSELEAQLGERRRFRLVRVEEIPSGPGDKGTDFYSEFYDSAS